MEAFVAVGCQTLVIVITPDRPTTLKTVDLAARALPIGPERHRSDTICHIMEI